MAAPFFVIAATILCFFVIMVQNLITLQEDFVARCSRTGIGNSGMCLYERRIGRADIVVRFPRDWLSDWKTVSAGLGRLIARLHPG